MNIDQKESGRAYELLKRIHENEFHITESIKKEIRELFTPDWINDDE